MIVTVTYMVIWHSHVLKVLKHSYPPHVFFYEGVLVLGVFGSGSVVQNVSQTQTADHTPPVTVVVFAND